MARAVDPRASSPVYALGRCFACGTAITLLRTARDREALYRGGTYRPTEGIAETMVRPLRLIGERVALRAFARATPGSRVLEIGAGDGRLLAALRRRGCVVTGIEPFADAASAADVVPVAAEEVSAPSAAYDLVVLWHVLEHLDDPFGVLTAAVRTLRPDGQVVVAVPALDSLQARIGGDGWFHQDIPRHLLHFTRAGLVRLLSRSGLAVTRMRNFVPDQNLLGMTQTLLNRVTRERNVVFRLLKGDTRDVRRSDVAVSAFAAIPAAVVGSTLEAAAMLAGRGGSVVVEAALAPAG